MNKWNLLKLLNNILFVKQFYANKYEKLLFYVVMKNIWFSYEYYSDRHDSNAVSGFVSVAKCGKRLAV